MTAPRLRLILRRWPFGTRQEMRESTSPCTIGRGEKAQWRLADPQQTLSRPHCEVRPTQAGWLVTDLSANGTFLNAAIEPIGRGRAQPLADGDLLRLGDYEIEARLDVPGPTAEPPLVFVGTGWTEVGPAAPVKQQPPPAPVRGRPDMAEPPPATASTGWTEVGAATPAKPERARATMRGRLDVAEPPSGLPRTGWTEVGPPAPGSEFCVPAATGPARRRGAT